MKKAEMIKLLIEVGGEFTKKELNKMDIEDVQGLFNTKFKVEDEDFTNDLPIQGLKFGEDYVEEVNISEDGLIDNQTEAERSDQYIEEPEIEEEVIKIDFSKLSVVEQRQYRRTGILPKITINRYTRFDDEKPKMGN